jgi:ubiquinone biosynthesis protein
MFVHKKGQRMKRLQMMRRIFYIQWICAKWGLDSLLTDIPFFSPFRWLTFLNPWHYRRQSIERGDALRSALEELGPIFVKFGQALSTRPDIVPYDIANALTTLQDNVPPFSSDLAMSILQKALKQPLDTIFQTINPLPIASASMAQVHEATLRTGEAVVVKILRPHLRRIIQNDVAILRYFASLVEQYFPHFRRFKPLDMIKEFEQHLLDELDLQREAANASQLRRNFDNSPLLYVPKIYWDFTKENILVMEQIFGIPVLDKTSLNAHQINQQQLAERGVVLFFTQVFRDCFFHADMHPGNIFVSTQYTTSPQFICVDFGIMGTLNDNDKYYIAENLLAFFNRDYRRVATLHIESGWVSKQTRVDEFESAIRTVCEPIFERPLKDISFGQLILRLIQVARRFDMIIQPQLILLQKTLLAIEGLGRQLYPELDLWKTAKPFLEKWVKEQVGLKALKHEIKSQIPFLVEQLPHIPKLLYDVLALQKESLQNERHMTPRHNTTKTYHLVNHVLTGVMGGALMGACLQYTRYEPNLVTLSAVFLGALLVRFNPFKRF